jgi:hypothetical protein
MSTNGPRRLGAPDAFAAHAALFPSVYVAR